MLSFTLSAIVAYARHRVIGYNNTLPWHLPADLKRFRLLTLGKPIIMGRETHLSIGKALPERINIVLSRNMDFQSEGCVVMHSLESAVDYAKTTFSEAFIIGGSRIFEQALPLIDRLYITEIETECKGDAYFPELKAEEWKEISRESHAADDKNPHSYTYITLERLRLSR